MKESNKEAKKPVTETENEIPVRRTVEDAGLSGSTDPVERAKAIEAERIRDGIDPLTSSYKLHTRGQLPGWKYIWARDSSGRIESLTKKGYQRDESCEPISQGDNSGGGRLIRMMIPEIIFKKDFKAKQSLITEREKSLRKADVKGGLEQKDGAYGAISIDAKTVKLGSTQG